jgi:RES domain-containing protein
MIVFRLASSRHAYDLSGKGAELTGGRWNNKGIAVVYTSESRALCMLEVAVHLPLGYIPKDYVLISLQVPDTSIESIDAFHLAQDWNQYPPKPSTRIIGDKFVSECKTLLLQVPSVLVPDEHNFLINPAHPDFSQVKILTVVPFEFDSRFFIR